MKLRLTCWMAAEHLPFHTTLELYMALPFLTAFVWRQICRDHYTTFRFAIAKANFVQTSYVR